MDGLCCSYVLLSSNHQTKVFVSYYGAIHHHLRLGLPPLEYFPEVSSRPGLVTSIYGPFPIQPKRLTCTGWQAAPKYIPPVRMSATSLLSTNRHLSQNYRVYLVFVNVVNMFLPV